MATMTAQVDGLGHVVNLSLSALVDGVLTLHRTSESVVTQPVGAAYELPVVTGTLDLVDYEAPQRQALSYSGVINDVDGNPVDTIAETFCTGQVTRTGDYVFGVNTPSDGRTFTVEQQKVQEYGTRTDDAVVIGRADPIIVTDTTTTWAGSLVLVTMTDDDRQWLSALVLSGQPIGFCPYSPSYGYEGTQFLALTGKVKAERASRLVYDPIRKWTLPVQSIERPIP